MRFMLSGVCTWYHKCLCVLNIYINDLLHSLSHSSVHNQKPLLTVSFSSGDISLMNNYDDLSPTPIRTGLKGALVSVLSH